MEALVKIMHFNAHIKNDSTKITERLKNYNFIFDKTTIVITGAFGFLGQQFLYYFSTLVEDLGLDIKIIAFDNFITGSKENINSSAMYVSSVSPLR